MPEPVANPLTGESAGQAAEADAPPPGILMTSRAELVPASVIHRTPSPRIFPNGVPTNLNDIRPIISQAYSSSMSLTSWLNARFSGQSQVRTPPVIASSSSDSFVITLDDGDASATPQTSSRGHEHHAHAQRSTDDNFFSNIPGTSPTSINSDSINSNSNGDSNRESSNEADREQLESLPMRPEAQELLEAIQTHLPFVALLITKAIYDHRSGALCLALLMAIFVMANNDLKREIAKQAAGSCKYLMHVLFYMVGAIVMTSLVLDHYPFYFYCTYSSFWDLLWGIIVTDFVLKLFTIGVKTLLTLLPGSILEFQKRGKFYLLIEAMSQFYRSTAPAYSWAVFFKDAYQGPEFVLGMIMAFLYCLTKLRDLLRRGKFLVNAFVKFCQNAKLGSPPSKEQLAACGGTCVICHDEFSTPVQLCCKHIFCERCVASWLDRQRTCPLCRSSITDDPIYRDGHTTLFIQFY